MGQKYKIVFLPGVRNRIALDCPVGIFDVDVLEKKVRHHLLGSFLYLLESRESKLKHNFLESLFSRARLMLNKRLRQESLQR